MIKRYNDIHDRLPLYDELVTNVRHARQDGAFEVVDPAILDLMEGATPVGLDARGRMQIPDWYDPEDGPAVLMTFPGERSKVRYSKGMEKSIGAVSRKTDIDTPAEPGGKRYTGPTKQNPYVRHIVYDIEDGGMGSLDVAAPLYLMMPSACTTPNLAPPLYAHEVDHWEFFMRRAPRLYDLHGPRYDFRQLKTVGEKSGYDVSYLTEYNMGFHRGMPSPDEFAAEFIGLPPEEAGERVSVAFRERRTASPIGNDLKASLGARALTILFGSPGEMAVNEDEVIAYTSARYA
ncbi:MAG TPA: hypothetical protein VF572_05160 [Candidatus Saccharimonadales bacterium]|jgi:hypothetical protein